MGNSPPILMTSAASAALAPAATRTEAVIRRTAAGIIRIGLPLGACFGIGGGRRRPLLADPAGADRRQYRGVRTRSATNRAAKSGRPGGLRREGRLMRRKARRYSPVSASLFSCHAAFPPH